MRLAVYTTSYNNIDQLEEYIESIPEDISIYITDLASTDGTYETLLTTRATVFRAQFDPVSSCKALSFTLVQIPEHYDYCLNLNMYERFVPEMLHSFLEMGSDIDGMYLNLVELDSEGTPDYLDKEIRLHRNTDDWVWHYSYLPKLYPRKSVDIQYCGKYNVVRKYEEIEGSSVIQMAKDSYSSYHDGYSTLVYADTLLQFNQHPTAIEMYLKVLDLDSTNEQKAKAYCSLAYLNGDMGISDVTFLLQYHALDYKNPESHLEMARHYYSKKWYNSALGYIESGLALIKSDIKTDNLSVELGCVWKLLDIASYCCWELKRTADFELYLLKAYQANPESKRIASNIHKHFKRENIETTR